jgi:hypothetical protein
MPESNSIGNISHWVFTEKCVQTILKVNSEKLEGQTETDHPKSGKGKREIQIN